MCVWDALRTLRRLSFASLFFVLLERNFFSGPFRSLSLSWVHNSTTTKTMEKPEQFFCLFHFFSLFCFCFSLSRWCSVCICRLNCIFSPSLSLSLLFLCLEPPRSNYTVFYFSKRTAVFSMFSLSRALFKGSKCLFL